MGQNSPGQMIQVPNTLKLKVGGRFGGIDPSALAKAEAALKGLSENFGQWLQDELTKLDAARARVRAEGVNQQTAEGLYLRAHDLKGLGSTYGFPLVTQLAGSLCKLIDEPSTREKASLFLIDAHIDAIKAAVRDNIRDENHPVGRALLTELSGRVTQALG